MSFISDNAALWGIAIGVGLVVVICVIILLSLLTAFVADIDRNVGGVGVQLEHVVANTHTSLHLFETARLIGLLDAELQAHAQALSSAAGPL